MAKLTRKWIELDWANTNLVLRAEDIPFSIDQSIKEAIDSVNGKVAVNGGASGFLEDVLQAGDNISFNVDTDHLIITSDDRVSQHEEFVITEGHLTDGHITTTYDIFDPEMVSVSVMGGTTLVPDTDYYINNNNIVWTGHELANFIEVGDKLKVVYTRALGTPGAMTNFRKIKIDSNYTAAVGNELLVDTSVGVVEVTFPPTPVVFDEVKITDVKGTFNTNNVVVKPNGKNIKGDPGDFLIDIDGVSASFIFYDEAYGWMVKTQ
jgi:hypothetical protein